MVRLSQGGRLRFWSSSVPDFVGCCEQDIILSRSGSYSIQRVYSFSIDAPTCSCFISVPSTCSTSCLLPPRPSHTSVFIGPDSLIDHCKINIFWPHCDPPQVGREHANTRFLTRILLCVALSTHGSLNFLVEIQTYVWCPTCKFMCVSSLRGMMCLFVKPA